MKRRKALSAIGIASLSLGLLFSAGPQVSAKNVISNPAPSYKSDTSYVPIDLGIANEDKLIEMLKKSGKILAYATPEESQKQKNSLKACF